MLRPARFAVNFEWFREEFKKFQVAATYNLFFQKVNYVFDRFTLN